MNHKPPGPCPVEFLSIGDIIRRPDGDLDEITALGLMRRANDPGPCRVEITFWTERGEHVGEDYLPGVALFVWATAAEMAEKRRAAA